MTLKKEISLNDYCEYIKRNSDFIEVFSVLDGIGDPAKTWANQKEMESRGLSPLPCFHYGEDERWLEFYVKNYPYITLGGMVPNSPSENQRWLDRIWPAYLCHPDGSPKVKVHGFGMTSIPLMKRYPWFSVDSSSWVQFGFYGAIVLPEIGPLHISDQSSSRKTEWKHFNNLPDLQKLAVKYEIEKRGFDPERVSKVYISRWVFNLVIYDELNRTLEQKELRFKAPQIPLF
jgi:hypothetical protein